MSLTREQWEDTYLWLKQIRDILRQTDFKPGPNAKGTINRNLEKIKDNIESVIGQLDNENWGK